MLQYNDYMFDNGTTEDFKNGKILTSDEKRIRILDSQISYSIIQKFKKLNIKYDLNSETGFELFLQSKDFSDDEKTFVVFNIDKVKFYANKFKKSGK